jgi:uncharacterized protein YdcH (DUF465 family)
MPTTSQDIRQFLLDGNQEFRRLAEEHSRCESELETLLDQSYTSSEDLIQEAVLKKQKLRLKDQMEMIVAQYQHKLVHH